LTEEETEAETGEEEGEEETPVEGDEEGEEGDATEGLDSGLETASERRDESEGTELTASLKATESDPFGLTAQPVQRSRIRHPRVPNFPRNIA
jgi:hypothetical protein